MLAISLASKDVKMGGANISNEAEIEPAKNLRPSGTNTIHIDGETLKNCLLERTIWFILTLEI